jgi:hypothetical protein
MTPKDTRWEEFASRLEESLAPEVDQYGHKIIRWWCGGTHHHCVDVLRGMGLDAGDVEASLAYFRDRGGYCDCEVMFNVVCLAGDEEPAS